MRVVITGAHGQLGRALTRAFARHEIVPLGHAELDVTSPQAAERLVRLHPQIILHTAAMTEVDGCELDPRLAHAVNAEGTGRVARAAARLGIPLVYFSTDYVFPGDRQEPYRETDPGDPINAYGRSKLAGEEIARRISPASYVVRTAWLYGDGNRSFVGRMLELGRRGEPFHVVSNEIGSPTYAADLARAVAELVGRGAPGVYHLVNEGQASRFQLARASVELAGLDPELVQPTDHFPRPARRPPRAVLANQAARALGIVLRPWPEALRARVNPDLP